MKLFPVKKQGNLLVLAIVGLVGYTAWCWHKQNTAPMERANATVSTVGTSGLSAQDVIGGVSRANVYTDSMFTGVLNH
jgi:hypothetical protein